MISSPLFCTHCGAANLAQAAFCYACGQAISTPGNAFVAYGNGPLQVGALLKQRYQITQQIGTGGFGAVYQAEDLDLGKRLVAVKEMSQHNLSPQEIAEAMQAFKQEALLLADLMHEHLPRIYDHFSEGGRWYLVMDYIRGETLEDHLQKAPGERLALDDALKIALQLCSVLDYLHTRQPPIIFRDLKPANVILTPAGNLFLIDFGIARHFKPGQAKDTVAFGSPGYAPPEQYGKAQTTPRADIYALGAILHQMISGTDPSLVPFRFAPLIINAPALQHLLERMLELDESKRPASMAEVQQELERIKAHPQNAPSSLPLLDLPLPALRAPSQFPSLYAALFQPRVTRPVRGPNFLIYEGHASPVHSVSWSPNGEYIASASSEIVRVWDVRTGNEICAYQEHLAQIVAMAWSPKSMHIASLSRDNNLRFWNANDGQTVRNDSGGALSKAWIQRLLAWSPDAQLLALAGEGKAIQITDVLTHQLVDSVSVQPSQVCSGLSWSPNGRFLASLSGRSVNIWSLNTKTVQLPRNHSEHVNAMAWSPTSDLIASVSNANLIEIWQVRTNKLIRTYANNQFDYTKVQALSPINVLTWSSNGLMLASGDTMGKIQIWDIKTGNKSRTYNDHTDSILSMAWSPNGRYLASGSADKTVRIWHEPLLFI